MRHPWLLLALALGCVPEHPRRDDPKSAEPTCAEACENLRQLGCEIGQDAADGSSCEQVCENAQAGAAGDHYPVKCLAEATACDGCDAA